MSRGWGLLSLQGHVLVGFWVSKVAGKGLGCRLHPLAFAALICHHTSPLLGFLPGLPRSAGFLYSSLSVSLSVCLSYTSHSYSLVGVTSEFESWLCLLASRITNTWSLTFPLCKMGTTLPSLNVECLMLIHSRCSIKIISYLASFIPLTLNKHLLCAKHQG